MATIFGTSGNDATLSGTNVNDLIFGLAGDDVIAGGNGPDNIKAGIGDDTVRGNQGNDTILGSDGNDVLRGGAGDDSINGGSDNDTIVGGRGNDTMLGGSGEDQFRFNGLDTGNDLVKSFNDKQDVIDLRGLVDIDIVDVTVKAIPGGSELSGSFGVITVMGLKPDEIKWSAGPEYGGNVWVKGAPCFLAGTMIAAPEGEVAVQDLRIGDLVLNHEGVARPVKWIGLRSYLKVFAKNSTDVTPVLIKAGALGNGLPHADLRVSPLHAMFFDGVFVRARDLVNGTTITFDHSVQVISYYHVELECHDVILANGAPTETYANHDSRRMFANWQDYVDLYGGEDALAADASGDFPRSWPLVEAGPEFDAVLARIGGLAKVAA